MGFHGAYRCSRLVLIISLLRRERRLLINRLRQTVGFLASSFLSVHENKNSFKLSNEKPNHRRHNTGVRFPTWWQFHVTQGHRDAKSLRFENAINAGMQEQLWPRDIIQFSPHLTPRPVIGQDYAIVLYALRWISVEKLEQYEEFSPLSLLSNPIDTSDVRWPLHGNKINRVYSLYSKAK